MGRLRPGISVETAAATIATVGRRLEQAFPSVNHGNSIVMSKPSSRLMFMPGAGRGATAGLALLLMLMPVIVLLVACLNLADLLLARSHVRRQELAIRSSLGGGRLRLTRQLLTEGLLLALTGAAAGLWLSTLATGALLGSLRQVLPIAVSLPDVSLDWRVLLSTLAFSLVATLVFAAGPALALTGRAAATDLKRRTGDEGGRPGGVRIGNALVIGQIALSLLLLACGGLFVMSALSASTADPGFPLDGGVVVQVDPALAGYDEARGREAHLALIDRLRTVPGVEAVTIGSRPPFTSIGDSRDVVPAGAADARSRSVGAVFSVVGRDYARVLGLPMLGGRDFSEAELAPGSGERVAIIDDALAEQLWPGEAALGRLIQFLDAEGPEAKQPLLVVGIIPAVKHSLGDPRPYPHVYVPLGQHYESDNPWLVRDRVRAAVRSMNPRLPVYDETTLEERRSLALSQDRMMAALSGALGLIALLLTAVGIYGVIAYSVGRRTAEIGIRMALGASAGSVHWMVVRETLALVAIGGAIGVPLALAGATLLRSTLFGVVPRDPLTLAVSVVVLISAGALGGICPRAVRRV